MISYSVAAVIAASVLLTAACSADGGGGPLVTLNNEATQVCVPAPNSASSDDIPAWNSPVGYALVWYYNASASPVVVESVSLIDTHNLVLHKAVVYEAEHEQNQLTLTDGWPAMSLGSDPAGWARRQSVPGAVIDPDAPNAGDTTHDAYEVVLDISAKTRAGGYTIRCYAGYEISPPGGPEGGQRCSAFTKAINAAWSGS
jgi:hypothetical protein